MTKQEVLHVISPPCDTRAPTRLQPSMITDNSATFERNVFYPYHRFLADCTVATILGKKSLSVSCLVDGVNALGATTDPFDVKQTKVVAAEIMATKVTKDEAHRAAFGILRHQISRHLKMMAAFDIRLTKQEVVYKEFWILRSRNALIMVDSVTGGIHPLRTLAA